MSQNTIFDRSQEIRNETVQFANTRGRVANVLDDINETKANKVDVDLAILELSEELDLLSLAITDLQETDVQHELELEALRQKDISQDSAINSLFNNDITLSNQIDQEILDREAGDAALTTALSFKLDMPTALADGSYALVKTGAAFSWGSTATLGKNIFNSNLTLDADRTQNLGAKKLTFTGGRFSVPTLELEVTSANSVPNKVWTDGVNLKFTNNSGINYDVGSNISNTDLTLTSARNFTQGSYSYTHDTGGQLYNITGLPDKSIDASFNRMIVQNSTGQAAWGNGNTLIKNMPSTLSDAEKNTWKTEMNGGWTTKTMSVGVTVPPVINNNNNNTWVLLKGANLNLPPTSFTVEIMNEGGTTVLETVPNSQVQLYQNGTDLVFYYNFSTLGLGKYKIRLWNGIAYYVTPVFIEVVANTLNVDFSKITWDIINYQNKQNPTAYFSGNTVSAGKDLKNPDGTDFNEQALTDLEFITAIKSNQLKYTDGTLMTMNDDFVVEINYSGGGNMDSGLAGLTNETINSLTNTLFAGVEAIGASYYNNSRNISGAGGNIGLGSAGYNYTTILIKRGQILTSITSGAQTVITTASVPQNNNGVFFKYIRKMNSKNQGGSTATTKFQAVIGSAYKLN